MFGLSKKEKAAKILEAIKNDQCFGHRENRDLTGLNHSEITDRIFAPLISEDVPFAKWKAALETVTKVHPTYIDDTLKYMSQNSMQATEYLAPKASVDALFQVLYKHCIGKKKLRDALLSELANRAVNENTHETILEDIISTISERNPALLSSDLLKKATPDTLYELSQKFAGCREEAEITGFQNTIISLAELDNPPSPDYYQSLLKDNANAATYAAITMAADLPDDNKMTILRDAINRMNDDFACAVYDDIGNKPGLIPLFILALEKDVNSEISTKFGENVNVEFLLSAYEIVINPEEDIDTDLETLKSLCSEIENLIFSHEDDNDEDLTQKLSQLREHAFRDAAENNDIVHFKLVTTNGYIPPLKSFKDALKDASPRILGVAFEAAAGQRSNEHIQACADAACKRSPSIAPA